MHHLVGDRSTTEYVKGLEINQVLWYNGGDKMPKRKYKAKEQRSEREEALIESEGLSSVEEALIEHELAIVESKPYVEPYKTIRYLGTPDILKIKGPNTGIEYTFTARERVSFVATEDYEGLLKRVRPARRCCGGREIPAQPYFGPV